MTYAILVTIYIQMENAMHAAIFVRNALALAAAKNAIKDSLSKTENATVLFTVKMETTGWRRVSR